jgi:hypothetical protein
MGFKSFQGSAGAGKRLITYVTNLIGSSAGGAGGSAAAGPGIAAITATGGSITTLVAKDAKNYKIHTFTAPGTFSVTIADPTAIVNVICLSGGNGGGSGPGGNPSCTTYGGGGPSGTFAHFQNVPVSTPGPRDVTVGGGGGSDTNGGTSSFIFSPGTPNSINLSCLPLGNPGGVPGSIILTPSPGSIILNHAVRITGGSGGGPPSSGFGGNVLPAIDSQSNLLYNAPISGYGAGGNGNGPNGGEGPTNPGSPGQGGFVRVFYQIPA